MHKLARPTADTLRQPVCICTNGARTRELQGLEESLRGRAVSPLQRRATRVSRRQQPPARQPSSHMQRRHTRTWCSKFSLAYAGSLRGPAYVWTDWDEFPGILCQSHPEPNFERNPASIYIYMYIFQVPVRPGKGPQSSFVAVLKYPGTSIGRSVFPSCRPEDLTSSVLPSSSFSQQCMSLQYLSLMP